MTNDLIKRLTAFLETFVPHERGWVAPSPDDYNEFNNIVHAIRDAKWARDEDNDATIEITLTDRSIGRRPWMPLMPYTDYDKPMTVDEYRRLMSCLSAAESMIEQVRIALENRSPPVKI